MDAVSNGGLLQPLVRSVLRVRSGGIWKGVSFQVRPAHVRMRFASAVTGTHDPVGTTFDPGAKKMGKQSLQIGLSSQLRPGVDFSFRRADYEGDSPVLRKIPPALNMPVEFEQTAYIRVGEATPRLSDNAQAQAALWREINSIASETDVANKFVTADEALNLVDYPKYFGFGQALIWQP